MFPRAFEGIWQCDFGNFFDKRAFKCLTVAFDELKPAECVNLATLRSYFLTKC